MRLRQFNLFIMPHQSGDLWGINRLQHAREMSFTARLIFLSHIPHGCGPPPSPSVEATPHSGANDQSNELSLSSIYTCAIDTMDLLMLFLNLSQLYLHQFIAYIYYLFIIVYNY